jgi:hypothetical protein
MVHAEQKRVTATLRNVLKVLDDVAKSSTTHLRGCGGGGRGERRIKSISFQLKLAYTHTVGNLQINLCY